MRIDDFLPEYDMIEHHEIEVAADPETTFRAVKSVDLSRSVPVRILFAARSVPRLLTGNREQIGGLGFDQFLKYGFVMLADDPPHEFLLGAIGRFWKPRGGIESVTTAEFSSFAEPGFAKAAMAVWVEEELDVCRAVTETRVLCLGESARRSFSRYWMLVRPFSEYIRRVMLSEIKRTAEA